MIRKWLLFLSLAFLALGCATTEVRSPILNSELIKQLQPGVTTKEEALTLLGSPHTVKAEKGLELWLYSAELVSAPAPPPRGASPTHALSKTETPVFSERGREVAVTLERKKREVKLFFKGNVLSNYQMSEQ